MSLRSLGYFITRRRFYPRKINGVQVESSPGIVANAAFVSAAGRPGRSLHTLRHLGAGANAYYGGALVAAALAGGLGILIFKKHHPHDDYDHQHLKVEKDMMKEPQQKMKEEGNMTKEDTKEVSTKPEVTDNKLTQEVTNLEKQDVDMEAMFHEWMKQVGRVYPNQEEETKRFELFKKTVKQDPLYGKSSVPYLPKSPLADRNFDEIRVKRVYRDEDLKELEALSRAMKERKQKIKEEMNSHNFSKQ